MDFVRPSGSLKSYRLVLVPCLMHVDEAARAALDAADGLVLHGPRTGSRDRTFRIPENLPPGPLGERISMRITQVSSLRPGLGEAVSGAINGRITRWREHVETGADVLARFEDARPALVERDRHTYLAGWAEGTLLADLMRHMAGKAGLTVMDLPSPVRIRRRGRMAFAFNYGPEPFTLPVEKADFILGDRTVAPQTVTAWLED